MKTLVQSEGIQISMDGKGRALDNIFVERFFRNLKYEDIYLDEYMNPRTLRKGLNHYIRFYNEERLHGALDYSRSVDYYRRPQVNGRHPDWHVPDEPQKLSHYLRNHPIVQVFPHMRGGHQGRRFKPLAFYIKEEPLLIFFKDLS